MRKKLKTSRPVSRGMIERHVKPGLRELVSKKFSQIDRAKWPFEIKNDVKHLVYAAACNENIARYYAKPKVAVPHAFLVQIYANTLFREFNRFFASKNLEEFIAMRQPLPGRGRAWYGTKKEVLDDILQLLEKNRIPKKKIEEVREFVSRNQKKLTVVQLHRVQHYVVGLVIAARHGLV